MQFGPDFWKAIGFGSQVVLSFPLLVCDAESCTQFMIPEDPPVTAFASSVLGTLNIS